MEQDFEDIVRRYRQGKCTPEEVALVEVWYAQWNMEDRAFLSEEELEGAEAQMRRVVNSRVRSRRIRVWYRVAAAALVVCTLSVGGYLAFRSHERVGRGPIVAQVHDVKAPIVNKARVTLAGGQQVFLDSVGNGKLAQQGGIQLVKLADGKIAYSGAESGGSTLIYNTLTNPRGSRVIHMTLADGSQVWLNAGSSVTYPIAFVGRNRQVSVMGEAYFEVADDPSRPFVVTKGAMQVAVLGTRFNVNAYEDEPDIKVTLLEGKVKVSQLDNSVVLAPGQQAQVKDDVTIANGVDLEKVMAWKKEKFDFGEGTDLKDIMRQIARWYDVDIEYKGNVEQSFWGDVSRQVNVSEVLKKFELTGRVKFQVEGRKIIVQP